MLNKDINSRFEDWLLNPTESLDFEAKQWLDMSDVEFQGLVAKALIAMENHGGGFVLFGYMENEQKILVPAPDRPKSLEPYLTDSLNSIIKKRAEPSFHVQVTLQKHPETGYEYPLVRVAGNSKVPVRSDSETPRGTLKNNVYYIRAPGPESRAPRSASEWDALIRRAILNQREEIVSILRLFFAAGIGPQADTQPHSDDHQLNEFIADAKRRWGAINESLPGDDPAKITHGFYAFAAQIHGKSIDAPPKMILEAIEQARRYTGWPMFVSLHAEETRPKLVDGCLQASLVKIPHPDVAHADFWRVCPSGLFFVLRGYQEDSGDIERKVGTPGESIEATLPIWRLGEFLIRVSELGSVMFEKGFHITVRCEWIGISRRQLFFHPSNNRWMEGAYRSSQNRVETSGSFSQEMISDLLTDAVKELLAPLYEHFDFYQPPDSLYQEEIGRLRRGRF